MPEEPMIENSSPPQEFGRKAIRKSKMECSEQYIYDSKNRRFVKHEDPEPMIKNEHSNC